MVHGIWLGWALLSSAWLGFAMVSCGVAVVSLALLVMVIYGLLWLAWLDCGLWHRYGGQHSARLGKAMLCSAMVCLALLWLTWFGFGLVWLRYGWQWLTWLCYG